LWDNGAQTYLRESSGCRYPYTLCFNGGRSILTRLKTWDYPEIPFKPSEEGCWADGESASAAVNSA
jgi:hypothetical protein